MREFQYELMADYFQFYIQDESVDGNLGDSWTPEATDRLLALAPGVVGIGTVRNMPVPVTIQVHEGEPASDADDWDHVMECSLSVTSGKIVVAGCTDYFPDAARVEVKPGEYRVRASYGALETLSRDGLSGDDRYRVQLWPGEPVEVRVLKQRPTPWRSRSYARIERMGVREQRGRGG